MLVLACFYFLLREICCFCLLLTNTLTMRPVTYVRLCDDTTLNYLYVHLTVLFVQDISTIYVAERRPSQVLVTMNTTFGSFINEEQNKCILTNTHLH